MENKSAQINIEQDKGRAEESSISIAHTIAHTIEQELAHAESSLEGWKELGAYMEKLGFLEKRDVTSYLYSVMNHHGHEVVVRRDSLHRALDALEHGRQFTVSPMDTEPNAALLGSPQMETTGIEVALTGGFGWFIDQKIAGVYGFVPSKEMQTEPIEKVSLSHTKSGSELMRRIEGKVSPEDVLFFLFRAHKSAYPQELLTDDDFNDKTGEVNPFILRLYAKSRQAH